MASEARRRTILGTGNTAGTLDATADEITLAAGQRFLVWADQGYMIEVQSTTGFTMGANPVRLPAEYVFDIETGNSAMYLQIKRIDTDGNYYINRVG